MAEQPFPADTDAGAPHPEQASERAAAEQANNETLARSPASTTDPRSTGPDSPVWTAADRDRLAAYDRAQMERDARDRAAAEARSGAFGRMTDAQARAAADLPRSGAYAPLSDAELTQLRDLQARADAFRVTPTPTPSAVPAAVQPSIGTTSGPFPGNPATPSAIGAVSVVEPTEGIHPSAAVSDPFAGWDDLSGEDRLLAVREAVRELLHRFRVP